MISVLFGFLLSLSAAAHTIPICESLLTAKPIARTAQRIYPNEIDQAGSLYNAGEPLPTFETGFYLYLITSYGEILISPKYQLHTSPQNLVTHKSLLEMFRKKFAVNQEPVIVAAGEFQIAFDEVVEIRNKSGNFRGGPETLNLAVEIFKLHRLPMTSHTAISPVVVGRQEDIGHTPKDRHQDSFQIQILKAIYLSARGRALRGMYPRLFALLRETFPDARGRELVDRLMTAQAVGAGMTGYYDGYQTFYYPLQTAFTRDGFEYGIYASEVSPERGGADGFGQGVLKQFENFMIGAEHNLNPMLKEKWLSLASEFAQLEELNN